MKLLKKNIGASFAHFQWETGRLGHLVLQILARSTMRIYYEVLTGSLKPPQATSNGIVMALWSLMKKLKPDWSKRKISRAKIMLDKLSC
jgi:hypothetical protein